MSDKPLRLAQVLAGAEHGGAENFFVRLNAGLAHADGIREKAYIRSHPHRLATLRERGVETEGFRFGGRLVTLIDHLLNGHATKHRHPEHTRQRWDQQYRHNKFTYGTTTRDPCNEHAYKWRPGYPPRPVKCSPTLCEIGVLSPYRIGQGWKILYVSHQVIKHACQNQ